MVEMYCLDIFSTYSEGSEPSGIQLKNKQVHRAPYVNIMIWKCIVFLNSWSLIYFYFSFFHFFWKRKIILASDSANRLLFRCSDW